MDDIDTDFRGASQAAEVLAKYEHAMRRIRDHAVQNKNVHPLVFDSFVIGEFFNSEQDKRRRGGGVHGAPDRWWSSVHSYCTYIQFTKQELLQFIQRRRILYYIMYICLAFVCMFAWHYEMAPIDSSMSSPSSNPFSEPHLLYPSIRLWRRMTLPLIRRFPQLTEYHGESCLMKNPFFQLNDINCDTCSKLDSVKDVSMDEGGARSKAKSDDIEFPFVPSIFKMNQNSFRIDKFYAILIENYHIFKRDAYRVQSTDQEITNIDELFGIFNNTESSGAASSIPVLGTIYKLATNKPNRSHNRWRCNRMLPARLLRQAFGHPERLSKFGIAIERFTLLDSPQAPSYYLPETECRQVFVQQVEGSRFIILRPRNECKHECRALSVRLPESYVLMYDKTYWRPVSTPDPLAESTSIALVGSYC